jgi:mRNA interferase RelE/StbE
MKYKVELTKSAEKELLRLPAKDQQKVSKALISLQDNPRPHGYKKLKGEEILYRIRIGNYRTIYTIKDNILLVLVFDIGHRKDIYE